MDSGGMDGSDFWYRQQQEKNHREALANRDKEIERLRASEQALQVEAKDLMVYAGIILRYMVDGTIDLPKQAYAEIPESIQSLNGKKIKARIAELEAQLQESGL